MGRVKGWTGVLAAGAIAMSTTTVWSAENKGKVGIAMPTHAGQRWISDGKELTAAFQTKGYSVDLQYAEDDASTQLSELENMVTTGAKILVITPVDAKSLSSVLQLAADRGIRVIAYDRLLRDSPHVDYNVTFDNVQVGFCKPNPSSGACRNDSRRPSRGRSKSSVDRRTTTMPPCSTLGRCRF